MDHVRGVTLVLLQRFLAVAKTLHFTRAAKRLNVSQPLLSAQIRELEEALGTSLFVRTSRKVELTEAGAAFRSHAQALLIGVQDAVAATREIAGGQNLAVRIGYTDEFSHQILPQLVRRLKSVEPAAQIDLRIGPVPHLTSRITEASLDLALLCPMPVVRDIGWTVQMLPDAELVVGIRSDHPLAARPALSIEDIANEPFVASTVEESGSERLADRLFAERSFVRRITQRAADPYLMNSLAAAGVGIVLATKEDFAPHPTLAAVPIQPPVRLTRGAISRSSNQGRLLQKARDFLEPGLFV